jgi:predicted RNA-binding Zn ribbon-like protein
MKTIEDIQLLGGHPALDFINILDWRGSNRPIEYLNSYEDLVLWCRRKGILNQTEAGNLLRKASDERALAERIRKRAIKLREVLNRIFYSTIQGDDPDPKDMSLFNKALSRTMGQSRLIRVDGVYIWGTNGDKALLDWILNPIIRSAAELLVSKDLDRVKICQGAQCGWFFLDTSRNRSRRWCDMKNCGNRAKAIRFYNRTRKKEINTD